MRDGLGCPPTGGLFFSFWTSTRGKASSLFLWPVLRKLAYHSALYGLTTAAGRFLNWLLTPLYAYRLSVEDFGRMSELYAYMVFGTILVSIGMETTYLRFGRGGVPGTFRRALGITFIAGVGLAQSPLPKCAVVQWAVGLSGPGDASVANDCYLDGGCLGGPGHYTSAGGWRSLPLCGDPAHPCRALCSASTSTAWAGKAGDWSLFW